MSYTIGACSKCGGAVQIPDVWSGIVPPKPQCGSCGAVAKNAYGNVIPMEDNHYTCPLGSLGPLGQNTNNLWRKL